MSTSKTGKHGHAKCHFVAIDIFNGKKLEDIVPSSHNCDVGSFFLSDSSIVSYLKEEMFKDSTMLISHSLFFRFLMSTVPTIS